MIRVHTMMWVFLCLVSTTEAALQISVNGEQNPVDYEIYLSPSETAELGVWTDAAIPSDVFLYWALVTDTQHGSISGGQWLLWDRGIYIDPDPWDNIVSKRGYPAPPGTDGVGGTIAAYQPLVIEAGTMIYDHILYHRESGMDAELLLITTTDFVTYDIHDRYIFGIPEPAPLGLMLLGSLGLIRRRRI